MIIYRLHYIISIKETDLELCKDAKKYFIFKV